MRIMRTGSGIVYDSMNVADLKQLAERRGIKEQGVGWPVCCPPDGNKDDIIRALERRGGGSSGSPYAQSWRPPPAAGPVTQQQEAEDAQLAAAIAASLNLGGIVTPPPARVKRWGDGLEAPAAGSRHFVPQGAADCL